MYKYQQLSDKMALLSIQPVVGYNLTILNNIWSVFLRAFFNMLLACINIYTFLQNRFLVLASKIYQIQWA